MKKSNVLLIVIAVVLSAFLLWLWYDLGFNHIDNPLDLVISIIWWVIMVLAIACIVKVEKTRREKIRTAYLSDYSIFNSEAGMVALDGANVLDLLEQTIADLKYDFTNSSIEDEQKETIKKIIRTKKYKPAENDDEEPTWEGEVCVAFSDEDPQEFNSRAELAALL
jgi:hypothetical protein